MLLILLQNKNSNLIGHVQKMLPCIQSLHSKYTVNVGNQNESLLGCIHSLDWTTGLQFFQFYTLLTGFLIDT